MKTELQEKLFHDFPYLYDPEQNIKNGLMRFGFECGDGWYDLLRDLSEKLSPLVKAFNDTQEEEGYKCEVTQVKEKYGSLRFYMTSYSNEMSDIIDEYEEISEKTCEVCGNPGKMDRSSGWVSTLCETHRRK